MTAFALNFSPSRRAFSAASSSDNQQFAEVISLHPAGTEENTPEAIKPSLWARAKAVGRNLTESVRKDWHWMGASAGVGLAAKALTAAVVVPNAALLAGAAAGVLAVNTLRYIKERTAERSAIHAIATPLHQRTWGQAATEEASLYARHLVSKKFWARNLVGGTISAATFGLLSLGEVAADSIKDAFFAPDTEGALPQPAPIAPAQTIVPEAPVSTPPSVVAAEAPSTSLDAPPIQVEAVDPLQKVKELMNSSAASPSKAAQATLLRAEAGNAQAVKDLAFYVQNGKAGLPVDKDLARALFEQAALDGNKQAWSDLMWMEGRGAPTYDPAAKVASSASPHHASAGHHAPATGHNTAPSSVATPAPIAGSAAISPSGEGPLSTIPEETRRAALASVGIAPPQGENNLPVGRLAAECRPTVTSSSGGHASMLANCREFFNKIATGDLVRHIAPNGTTGEFVYAGEAEASTKDFRQRTLGVFISEKLSHFFSPR